jgi:hypothetical protein
MTTANITLTPVTAFTANAAALVILNRIDTQICRLNNAWSGGWNTIDMTVSDIKATYAALYQNIEFLSFIGVIETPDYEQLRTASIKARRGAIDRRDTFLANKAHDKIRNDLAKSYKPCDI